MTSSNDNNARGHSIFCRSLGDQLESQNIIRHILKVWSLFKNYQYTNAQITCTLSCCSSVANATSSNSTYHTCFPIFSMTQALCIIVKMTLSKQIWKTAIRLNYRLKFFSTKNYLYDSEATLFDQMYIRLNIIRPNVINSHNQYQNIVLKFFDLLW